VCIYTVELCASTFDWATLTLVWVHHNWDHWASHTRGTLVMSGRKYPDIPASDENIYDPFKKYLLFPRETERAVAVELP
jgi:hypothetical protein